MGFYQQMKDVLNLRFQLQFLTNMISKQDTQKRMLASKQLSPKNTKLVSLTNIANRSPTNKFENKQPITNNTLSSKKQLIQNKQKMVPMILGNNSPRNSVKISQAEMAKKNSYKQKEENNKNAINAEYNNLKNQNIVPERIEIAPKTFRNQNVVQVSKKEGPKIIDLPNGDIYTGDIVNGKYNGQGEYFFKNYNFLYKGEFKDGKQHKQGVLINLGTGEVVYQGGWDSGLKNGNGNYVYSPDQYYNGEWKNQQKDGSGFFAFYGGVYNGQWFKNKASGRGNLKLEDGTEFKGKFENNQFIDGTIKYPNGDQYYGSMKNNQRNSEQSSYYSLSTKTRYKGGYLNDKKHGKGTIIYQNGDQLSGTFRDGVLSQNEVVSYKWSDGTTFQGWFNQGKPQKGTVTFPNGQKSQI